MVPSRGASAPRMRVVSYPSGSSRRVRLRAWIAGPPTFSRPMMRRTRVIRSASVGKGRAWVLDELLDGVALGVGAAGAPVVAPRRPQVPAPDREISQQCP